MKAIHTAVNLAIPEGVTIDIKARKVVVTGPRGTLEREFKHTPVEITQVNKKTLSIGVWFGDRKHLACIRTICSHIANLMKGVTLGFEHKMRSAYSHFPINISIGDKGQSIEIRNFLGEKRVRRIAMLPGVTVALSDQKDEIVLRGNSVENVSQSAAQIQQSAAAKDKDVRKFLDGIYVSERKTVVTPKDD